MTSPREWFLVPVKIWEELMIKEKFRMSKRRENVYLYYISLESKLYKRITILMAQCFNIKHFFLL